MTQATKKGMWLRPAECPQKKNYSWILHTAAAVLAFTVLALAVWELTGFEKICGPQALLTTGIGLCVIWGVLSCFRRQGWIYPIVLIALLLLVLLCRQQLRDGICLFWNRMGDTWTAATGWVLPELEVSAGESEAGLPLVSVFFGGLGGLGCCLLVSGGAPVLAVLLSGLVMVGMILLEQDVSFGYLLPALVTAVLLLLCGGWGKGKSLVPTGISWVIFAAAASAFVWASGLPGLESGAADLSARLHEAVHTQKYETKYTTLPEGDFTDFTQQEGDPQPALIVTMEAPEPMYLRGFTGVTFENNVWSAMDSRVLAEHEVLLYWLNLKEFNPAVQFESAIFDIQTAEQSVTVQNIGACSRYLYVPFSLCRGEYPQAENLHSDSIISSAERIYVFSAVSGGTGIIGQVLETLQTSEEEPVLNYRRAESAYRGFVYDYYLQIPEEAAELLEPYGGPADLTPEQAQASALDFLARCFDENTDLELPLSAAEGTSFQYATVAVLALRYFGIPARYAEGYVITEEMAAEAEAGASIEVDSTCARAWVEVYQDGIGWIPMELTQGLEETEQEGSGDSGGKDDTDPADPKEGEALEEETIDNQEAPEPSGGSSVTISKALQYGFLTVLLLAVLLLITLNIRRKLILGRRERKFRSENRNDAIAWIFADAVALLEQLGFRRGNGSVADLLDPVEQYMGGEYAAMLREMIALNASAIFSSRALTEDQRETALEFRATTLKHLQSEIRWHRRVWMKWIRCLY